MSHTRTSQIIDDSKKSQAENEPSKLTDSKTESQALPLEWLQIIPKPFLAKIADYLPWEEFVNNLPLVSKHFKRSMDKIFHNHSARGKLVYFFKWLDKEYNLALAESNALRKRHNAHTGQTQLFGLGTFMLFASFFSNKNPYPSEMQKHSEMDKPFNFIGILIFFAVLSLIIRTMSISPNSLSVANNPWLSDEIAKFEHRFSPILGTYGTWMLALPPELSVQEFFDLLSHSLNKARCEIEALKTRLKAEDGLASTPTLNLEKIHRSQSYAAANRIVFWQSMRPERPDENHLLIDLDTLELKQKIVNQFR